ncbi:MAG: hypothetical protein ACAH21_01570 [Ramlibacter sp.]|nr:hypothetical protein [Ramlibacter sp.]
MPTKLRDLAPPTARAELGALLVVAGLFFIAIPLALGAIGLSWDALNHHIYLGWTAFAPRFDRDFLAASYQSFQSPYLYWPVYKLYQAGFSGQWAGAILASLNLLAVPPLWMLARTCITETSWYGSAMRWLAVALAFTSAVVLSMFDTTANDLLAAIPLVWAIALGMAPWDPQRAPWMTPARLVVLSGLCAGMAVAFKLSNGPLAILMPLLWVLQGPSLLQRVRHLLLGGVATIVGLVLSYGYWGWQLWVHYGNPIFPFYGHWFAPLAGWLGWQP